LEIPENVLMLVGNVKLTGTTIDLKNFSTKFSGHHHKSLRYQRLYLIGLALGIRQNIS